MDRKIPVSVIILTHNEEKNIKACLDSITGLVDEIFVVDSGSTDQTLSIVEGFTNHIYHHSFENYSVQRNWAQENLPIKTEWIFHMDADERCTSRLAKALQVYFADKDRTSAIAGLMVRRRIEFLGRHIKHGGLYPTYHCRMYKKQLGKCEDRAYDQHFVVEGSLDIVPADLTEVTASSLESWTARHNRWAQMEAKYLLDRDQISTKNNIKPDLLGSPIQRRRWFRVSILERTPLFFRSFLYFFYRYFLRGGFLDGKEGLIYHVLHGFWFRFYVDSCIYERREKC